MMSIIQYCLYPVILVVIAIPLGKYIKKVMFGEKTILSRFLNPVEAFIYRITGVDASEDMDWKKYLLSVLAFSLFGLIFLFILQIAQYYLPLNPDKLGNVKWNLAFNTAANFVTNTNWQAYSGESTLLEP